MCFARLTVLLAWVRFAGSAENDFDTHSGARIETYAAVEKRFFCLPAGSGNNASPHFP